MLRNYITIVYRNMRRQLSYSLINIIGLAVGLSCSLVIFLYVYGEWNYDKGYDHADRIYRVGVSFFNMGQFANGPEELLSVLPGELEGIETATRIKKDRKVQVRVKEEAYVEPFAFFTDSAFFHVFHYKFLSGDPQKVLKEPHSAVITKSLAQTYFKRTDVVGEVIEIGKERTPYAITGVVEDLGFNSHLKSNLWLSIQDLLTGDHTWTSAACYSYVLLREKSSEPDLRLGLEKLIADHVFPESGKQMGFKNLEDYKANDNSVKFFVHPLKDIYLKSKLSLEISPGGNETNTYIFSAISAFILILAGVNFANLTTARASRRAKEVGIRKTLGTSHSRLVSQFLVESVLTTMISMVFALFLAEVFLVVFSLISGTTLLVSVWGSPLSILLYIGFAFAVGLAAGIYPAFYLTSFSPASVLNGNTSGGKFFRNALVIFQFTVSITLVIVTVVVLQQLHFIGKKDLGFNQQNEVTIDNASLLGTSVDAFRNELAADASVNISSFHGGEPGSKRILSFYTYQTASMQSPLTINTYFGDPDYVPFMGFALIKGRNFSRDLASDTSGIILNEAAVKALGVGDNPVGAVINQTQKVIGVVRDFHWESLRNTIGPTAIILSKDKWEIGFRVGSKSMPSFLKKAEAQWKILVPGEPFTYHFMDENFGEMLVKEAIFGKAISFFSGLAIFISCLGLYGLAAFTSEQRTKEIGIRKVLGASASNIVILLNKNFTRLVLIAIFISVPLSIYAVSLWLDGFAYKVPLQFWTFGLSVLMALVIAWITVSYHSIRATLVNPADTLKYE